MHLKKSLDNTQNEKDLIGTQMVRRNDEIGLLNEKMQIIQMALDRGSHIFIVHFRIVYFVHQHLS